MKVILLDIEGTTTPIDFVHQTLFPFAKKRVSKFVETHFDSLRHDIELLVSESASDSTYAMPLDPTEPRSVAKYLEHLIEEDRKSTPLKSIQGKIWKDGYESGELKSIVYDDVLPAFERWKSHGKAIAIFSSGSVLAQQLLFRYTDHGDLTDFIDAYFDTTVGPKREAQSYEKIAAALEENAEGILFVSDIVAELDAAWTSGFQTALSVRPGNAAVEDAGSHRIVTTFDDLE